MASDRSIRCLLRVFCRVQAIVSHVFQLVAEFKRLGSRIVFADFTRLVVATRKHSIDDAMSYIDYVKNSITSKDLFHSIHLSLAHVSDS